MIKKFADFIPESVLSTSGSVFYSGRAAFSAPSKLYILGLNPGGCPVMQASETVAWHTEKVLNKEPSDWSAYSDESWNGHFPGTHGLQPRVLHMLKRLNLNPRHVPSSNVVFMRSSSEKKLSASIFREEAKKSWVFHRNVIDQLGVRVILCFGKLAGTWVSKQVGANYCCGEFVEKNNRKYKSVAYSNRSGIFVVVATHPSRFDWTAPASDPTPLLQQVLEQVRTTG